MDDKESKKRQQYKKWKIATGCVVLFSFFIIVIPYMLQLDEDDIDRVLLTALTERHNIPSYACISIMPGEALPGNIETKLLVTDDKGTVRKDVAALISNGLVTVRFNTGKVPSQRARIKAFYARKDVPEAMMVPSSYVDLTPLGKKFYRYDDLNEKFPHGVVGVNLFCAHVQYGGVEKFMTPAKNPFDDNPHQVTWVNFRWKPDEHATPWLADSELSEWLSIGREKDGWMHSGILLERDDEGVWGLGKNPYAIRW
ncbi:hypothetical protein [Klebsiella spallanzanii]|uniref:hypothetical protein n=1 Tax=Klebsiella spallanzanii TaxID=2587528 RepID=UPI00115B6871|nr:hypothetical protein [Klebsiella spallanzanii]VUS82409.1 hypothetical protein SB6419_04489 [Klebsiella spallanzanii]